MRSLICHIMVLAALGAAASAQPPARVVLRERATVSEGTVVLADIAELAPGCPAELAGLPLGNAPWPGHVRRMTRSLVAVRMVSAGFEPQDLGGAEACLIERAYRTVSGEQMAEAARAHLREQFPDGGPDVRIELLQDAPPALVPEGEGELELRPCLHSAGPPAGIVRVDVDLVRDGRRLKKVPLSFTVSLTERVVVAVRRIGPGEPFGPANVAVARRDVTPVPGVCVRSPAELEGKVADATIQPGQVVTRRRVREAEKPLVIELNQRVRLVVETSTLRAVTLGKALGRARLGEAARARNLSTGREVVGTAVEGSTIRVALEGQPDEPLQ